jgi:hypothetical protein
MMDVTSDQACWGYLWRKGIHKNIRSVNDFYTKRNLWALAAIIESLQEKNLGATLVNMAGMNVSKMRQVRIAGGGLAKGTYYIPPVKESCPVRPIPAHRAGLYGLTETRQLS